MTWMLALGLMLLLISLMSFIIHLCSLLIRSLTSRKQEEAQRLQQAIDEDWRGVDDLLRRSKESNWRHKP